MDYNILKLIQLIISYHIIFIKKKRLKNRAFADLYCALCHDFYLFPNFLLSKVSFSLKLNKAKQNY